MNINTHIHAHIFLYVWHIYTIYALTHIHTYTRKVVIAIVGLIIMLIIREIQ